jgi:hypothetical protein
LPRVMAAPRNLGPLIGEALAHSLNNWSDSR